MVREEKKKRKKDRDVFVKLVILMMLQGVKCSHAL